MGVVRRNVVVVVAVAIVVGVAAGCGGSDPSTGGVAATGPEQQTSAPSGPRSVDTPFGPVEVPANPRRVVALDEYAALNAMALGVQPSLVFTAYQSEVGGLVLADAGIETQPASAEAVNFEAVAAASPDLIILSSEGAAAPSFEQLSEIAPTVPLPYNVPWREAIETTGEIFGREAESERLLGILEGELSELQASVANEPQSISILADTYGLVFAASMRSPMSELIDEAGFTRPVAQAEGEPDTTYEAAVMISLENLSDHDADLVVVLSGAYYNAATFTDAPTFAALGAVEDGRSVVVDGDMWFGTYPFAFWWLMQDLSALHAGEGQDGVGAVDDVTARWTAFEELVS